MSVFGPTKPYMTLRLDQARLCLRSHRKAGQLTLRSPPATNEGVLLFSCMRDERDRLPEFLDHYRHLGVSQFFVVDNGSRDGSAEYLSSQRDVALWTTEASFGAARFGMDWLRALTSRHGMGRWCLTVDADELLIYPNCDTRSLPALTSWLENRGLKSLPALLLDMYSGPERLPHETAGLAQTPWFDTGNYHAEADTRFGGTQIRGGPRERAIFPRTPGRAPLLNKVPLVKWSRGTTYVNSTHQLLPRHLNAHDETVPSGVLLHSKFPPGFGARAAVEAQRREHRGGALEFRAYQARAIPRGGLWHDGAARYTGWRQLEALGLMSRGVWA